MAEQKTKLSIVIRAVDNATAKIKAINERLDAATKPIRDFRKALGELREKSGLDQVVEGFKGVGSAIAGALGKLTLIGGAAVGAGLALKAMVDDFSTLADVAARFGSGVDTVARFRYVASRSGASAEQLDRGLDNLAKNMGELRARGGAMLGFLSKVSPALVKQLKGTKSNEEAFLLLADAMAKIKDPAKRAVFAAKTLGDPALAQTLGRGAAGIQELGDRYTELAGSQEEAAAVSGEVGDSFHDLRAATDGIKAALVTGLAPALKVIVERLRDWLKDNRARIAEWAKSLGDRLPAAIDKLAGAFRWVFDAVRPFVDSSTKLKVIAVALAAVIAGPLISAITSLGIALFTTPIGPYIAAFMGLVAVFKLLYDRVGALGAIVGTLATAFVGLFGIKRVMAFVDQIKAATKAMLGLGEATAKANAAAAGGGGKWLAAAGRVLLPVAAADAVSEATGGSLVNVARSKGMKADNIVDLFHLARQVRDDRAGTNSSSAKVTVDFANAPRGTRVTADPQSTAEVDLSVGYQMIPGGL